MPCISTPLRVEGLHQNMVPPTMSLRAAPTGRIRITGMTAAGSTTRASTAPVRSEASTAMG